LDEKIFTQSSQRTAKNAKVKSLILDGIKKDLTHRFNAETARPVESLTKIAKCLDTFFCLIFLIAFPSPDSLRSYGIFNWSLGRRTRI